MEQKKLGPGLTSTIMEEQELFILIQQRQELVEEIESRLKDLTELDKFLNKYKNFETVKDEVKYQSIFSKSPCICDEKYAEYKKVEHSIFTEKFAKVLEDVVTQIAESMTEKRTQYFSDLIERYSSQVDADFHYHIN